MNESAETLSRLQAIIDRSARTAGAAIALNFIGGGWAMSAQELVAFWGEARMATVSTASLDGTVHAVPLDVRLIDGLFHIATFRDARRLGDHRENARCAITSWDDAYHAAIVYGRAHVNEEAAATMVRVEVKPSRIYAIRAPQGHHAHRP
jgi:hypothetical protein